MPYIWIPVTELIVDWFSYLTYQVPRGNILLSDEDLNLGQYG